MNPEEYQVMAQVEQQHPWFVNRRRLVRNAIRRFASGIKSPVILDAGSGTGSNLEDYATFGRAVGIEFEDVAARISAERGCERVVVGDLCHLPFGDGEFDLVISTDVIEHITDDVAALCEMRRVLRPEGIAIITTPAYSWAFSDHDRWLHHVRRYDKRPLRTAIEKSGFRVRHLSRYNVALCPPMLAARLLSRNSKNGKSDVGKPVPALVRPFIDLLLRIESRLAPYVDFRIGLTHLAVLSH